MRQYIMENIIISLITAGIPAAVTIISNRKQNTESRKNAAKSSLLQLMQEDYVRVGLMDKLPENFENIHHEFDIYKANYGNSYMAKKLADYDEWYENLELGKH